MADFSMTIGNDLITGLTSSGQLCTIPTGRYVPSTYRTELIHSGGTATVTCLRSDRRLAKSSSGVGPRVHRHRASEARVGGRLVLDVTKELWAWGRP